MSLIFWFVRISWTSEKTPSIIFLNFCCVLPIYAWVCSPGYFGGIFIPLRALVCFYTVRMIEIAHFSVHILLLHHYKSDFAHTSYLYSLVIGLYKAVIWTKKIKKRMTSSICTQFAHFLVVSVRKCMVKKYLISYRLFLLDRFFFRGFLIFSYELFLYYLVKKESVILRSLSCFNPYIIL